MRLVAIALLAIVVALPAFAAKTGRVDARQADDKRAADHRKLRLQQAEREEARKLLKDYLVDTLLKLALIGPDRRLLQSAGMKIVGPNTAGPGRVAFPEREVDLILIRIRFCR